VLGLYVVLKQRYVYLEHKIVSLASSKDEISRTERKEKERDQLAVLSIILMDIPIVIDFGGLVYGSHLEMLGVDRKSEDCLPWAMED